MTKCWQTQHDDNDDDCKVRVRNKKLTLKSVRKWTLLVTQGFTNYSKNIIPTTSQSHIKFMNYFIQGNYALSGYSYKLSYLRKVNNDLKVVLAVDVFLVSTTLDL